MDRVKILADVIEPVLSGQYGRDTAEAVAAECVEILDMTHPIKWQVGLYGPRMDSVNWNWGGFVYADNELQAAERSLRANEWCIKSFGPGHSLHVRPFPQTEEK